jgi:FKBP-type peptidyl-prolyl cis-trans isomerase
VRSKSRTTVKKSTSVAMLVAIAACTGACNRQPHSETVMEPGTAAEASQEDFKTLEDRYSYAYGANLAEQFKAEGIEMNVDLMGEAMQAVFDGSKKKMSAGEIAATIRLYQEAHAKQKEAEWAVAIEKNRTEGEGFLRENARKEGVVVTKSGLQYRVITPGDSGDKPTLDDDVKVHYRGRLIDGTEFDSTYSRDEPYSTNPKALIEGWAEALTLMSKGSKWELYVPAHLAYGEAGSPPYVGPNAVLIFEVVLLDIMKRH